MLNSKPLVRPVTGNEIDAMLSNIAHSVRESPFPHLIAFRVMRRGKRRDGTKINSPRRKPLFLHLLLVASHDRRYKPKRVWLGDVELQLNSGWADNPEWCDRDVSLVYCKPISGRVPRDILAKCCNLKGRSYLGYNCPQSYIYLCLEWRRWAFPSGIPEVRVE